MNIEFSDSINRALWASEQLTKVALSGGTAWQRDMAQGRFEEDIQWLMDRINFFAFTLHEGSR